MALTTLPTAAFATGSVGTSQLADGAVTTEKLVADVNFRNLIINGDMSIAQRSTSVSSITSGGYKTLDRFNIDINSAGTWTMSQSTTVPSGQGFATSLKMDCTTADASLSASDYLIVRTLLEGQNLQQLKFGTSSAESLTLSFWVRSNKTGTYAVWFYADVGNKSFSKTYTIDSADTWEKKTITINGDTASSFSNNNSIGLRINWYLAAGTTYTSGTLPTDWQTDSNGDRAVGQVNLADSTSNEWFITGIQLEADTSASDFEFIPYDVNYRRCQRYYEKNAGYTGFFASNSAHLRVPMVVPKRTQSPSISWSNSPMTVLIYGGSAEGSNSGSSGTDQRSISFANDAHHIRLLNMTGTGASNGNGCILTDSQYVIIDAEL